MVRRDELRCSLREPKQRLAFELGCQCLLDSNRIAETHRSVLAYVYSGRHVSTLLKKLQRADDFDEPGEPFMVLRFAMFWTGGWL